MTKKDYGDVHDFGEFLRLMDNIERDKGQKYGTQADPLANYTMAGSLFGDSAQKVMLQRVQEKVLRAANSLQRGENIDLDDAIDVAIIMAKAYLSGAGPRTINIIEDSDGIDTPLETAICSECGYSVVRAGADFPWRHARPGADHTVVTSGFNVPVRLSGGAHTPGHPDYMGDTGAAGVPV